MTERVAAQNRQILTADRRSGSDGSPVGRSMGQNSDDDSSLTATGVSQSSVRTRATDAQQATTGSTPRVDQLGGMDEQASRGPLVDEAVALQLSRHVREVAPCHGSLIR